MQTGVSASCSSGTRGRDLQFGLPDFTQHHIYTDWDFIYSKLVYLVFALHPHAEHNLCLQMHCYNSFFCTLFILQTMKLQGFPSANLSILRGKESGCRMDFIFICSYWSLDSCLLQVLNKSEGCFKIVSQHLNIGANSSYYIE